MLRRTTSDWNEFCSRIGVIFDNCKHWDTGKLASYIPQLAKADPEQWAVSVCTVDGRRESWGDFNSRFCLQSVSKPFTYALAIEELGADYVHRFVGQEPSGRLFNEICLDHSKKPHNPMINAGAIACVSLLLPDLKLSDRFDMILHAFKRYAGGEQGYISFDNSTFLSERESADRNYALAYFMREHKCFPDGAKLHETLDLYFQLCSIRTNVQSLAVMAATLANGGINPLSKEKLLQRDAVKHTLSLMLSCGMYDYSGQFAFEVGLPAKSGVSGDMVIVVPNVMGIGLFSPRLDLLGNTVRGVRFAEELVDTFHYHQYDYIPSDAPA